MHTQTAAAEIHEEQLLNFIVNRLTEAVPLDLAANASIAPDDLWEVLVGACADGTSISTLCATSQDAPHANTILHHLRTKLDLDALEELANSLLQTEVLEVLPDQAEFVVDLHLRPYYGDEADTAGLYHSQARAGTTAFHAYATLYARVRDKRYTLAIRRVTDGDTPSQVLAEFLGRLDSLDAEVIAVYLDREFYDSKCLTLLQAHNVAYVMPVVKWGRSIKRELSVGWSRTIQHSLQASVDGATWTVEFPVYIDATYQCSMYDEHGVARHGYAADAPFIDSSREARYHYAKRFGIEASYRLGEQTTASTTTQDPAMRFLFIVVSLVIQNSWRYLHWEYVSMPRRGGRQLLSWPFEEYITMVTRAAWRALRKRRTVPANRPPDDRFER